MSSQNTTRSCSKPPQCSPTDLGKFPAEVGPVYISQIMKCSESHYRLAASAIRSVLSYIHITKTTGTAGVHWPWLAFSAGRLTTKSAKTCTLLSHPGSPFCSGARAISGRWPAFGSAALRHVTSLCYSNECSPRDIGRCPRNHNPAASRC